MTKTIEQLWRGEIEPMRHLGRTTPEVRELEGLMLRNLEKLEANLNETAKETLEKYNDCNDEYTDIISKLSFCDGFCLGTRLAAEALTGTEQVIESDYL